MFKKIGFVFLSFAFVACSFENYDKKNPPINTLGTTLGSNDTVFYAPKVSNIFAQYCIGCHSEKRAEEDVKLDTYENAVKHARSCFEAMKEGEMPPNKDKLPAEIIYSVQRWVETGALKTTVAVTLPTYTNFVQPLIDRECKSCHVLQNQGGVDLSTFSNVKDQALMNLMDALKDLNGIAVMPPTGVLPQNDINQMQLWINNGMPN